MLTVSDSIYCIYVVLMLVGFFASMVGKSIRAGTTPFAQVKRGQDSLRFIHGVFVVASGVHLALSSIAIGSSIELKAFAFPLVAGSEACLAYLIYTDGGIRNWLVGLKGSAAMDR